MEFISNISLKRKISKQDRDNLLSCLPNFNNELQSAYDRDLGVEEALTQFYSISWYEFVSYTIEETNGTFSKIQLHLNDYITINDEDYGESYAVIKGIFRHKGNNGKYYAFIVIDWFKNINQKHSVLECPLYQIQGIGNQRWKNVFSIHMIHEVQKVHFVHNCNSECQDHYNTTNRIWIKNDYYFTAI